MRGAPFTLRPFVLAFVDREPGASSTDVLVELERCHHEVSIGNVCHALRWAVEAGELERRGRRGEYRYFPAAPRVRFEVEVPRRIHDLLVADGDAGDVAAVILARWAGRRRASR